MNQLIIAITFTVILEIVSGAPLFSCDKIQGETITNRYKVTLKNPEDANNVIEIVDNYQSIADPSVVESKLEPLGDELVGSLSKQALALVCMDSRVESIEHQVGVFPWPGHEEEEPVDSEEEGDQEDPIVTIYRPGPGSGEESVHCSLSGNSDDTYHTYRFIYNNETDEEELNEITKKLEGDGGKATVVPGDHSIISTINRDAYYETCEDSSIQCVEYYPSTNIASNVNGDSCKEDLVEDSALFSVEIRKPMSLMKRQARCERLKENLQKKLQKIDFWSLSSADESCETGENGIVTLHVWLNRRSHQFMCKIAKDELYVAKVDALSKYRTC